MRSPNSFSTTASAKLMTSRSITSLAAPVSCCCFILSVPREGHYGVTMWEKRCLPKACGFPLHGQSVG